MSNNAVFVPRVLPNLYSRLGWADYAQGRPFPPEYEHWDEKDQRHYERGRLRASGALLAGYARVPPTEPNDIIDRTNGLKLVPRGRKRDPRTLPRRFTRRLY